MGNKKYYVVYSSGKLEEVDKKTYDLGFNDPYVTLIVEEAGEWEIEQLTEESEDEPFKRI